MLKEDIEIREEYLDLGMQIVARLQPACQKKCVVAVGGESGSGKTVTAKSVQLKLQENNISSYVLHLDSYFKMPPKDNHTNRLQSLENVGPEEVNLNLLQQHVDAFKQRDLELTIPVVDYLANRFESLTINIADVEVLIIEGVYSFMLQNIDFKVFMERTYKHTQEVRQMRSREVYDPYVEQILEIEHKIIAPLVADSDVVIDVNYAIR